MRKRNEAIETGLVAILLVLATVLLAFGPQVSRRSTVVEGVMDLRGWDPVKSAPVFVSGKMEFYWMKLLDPADLRSSQPMTGYVVVPRSWNTYVVDGKRLPSEGYATYSFVLRTDATGKTLALNIPSISTAYKLWIGDDLKVSVGQVGTSAETHTPYDVPTYVEFVDDRPETRITIQVANYTHRRGGLVAGLELGAGRTVKSLAERRLLADAASFGALSFMGIYHICLFTQRRGDKKNFYFGLLCVAFSARTVFVGQVMASRILPSLRWDQSLALQYFASSAILPLGAAYVEASYPDDVKFSVTRLATVGWIIFASISLTMSPMVSMRSTLYYEVFDFIVALFILSVLISAFRNRRSGSRTVALGCVVFMVSLLVDLLHYESMVRFSNFSQMGLVVLCFMQSYSLSVRFTEAMETVEHLSEQLSLMNKELTDLNRHLEERVDLRTTELLESNRKLEAINQEIARMDGARRQLLANIAHDLRTPVTLIGGYAEAILDGVIEGPKEQAKYLGLIRSKVADLTGLIEDLFELTQLESRRTAFDPQPVDVLDLIETLFTKYEHDIERAGLRPRLVLPELSGGGGPFYVNVDSDRIDRVLSNLLFNSAKFADKGTELVVGCSVSPKEAIVTVQDSGPGIAEEDIPFIFDRFYKSPRSRTGTPGSGLGLSIAKEIVALHNGRIWVESNLGEGSTFCFTLPLTSPPREDEA